MGIPHLYREIVKNSPHVIVDNISTSVTRLFLDFNSIIHQCVNELKTRCVEVDIHIFKEIVDYTNTIAKICKPSQLLYIAIDGVATIAKQHQQRKRRYLSVYTNEQIEKFKNDKNIKYIKWDSNQITPGTEFMKKLNVYLTEYYNTHKFDFKIILSGSDQEGEGEHKIINYIKENPINDNESDVIYGLDGDLIMLTLTCSGSKNIYLMRESINFKPTLTNDLSFKYVNIQLLRIAISNHLYGSNDISYMYDYVFICFLIGNDFLPNIPCLKIRFNAIDIICNTYKKVFELCSNTNLILYDNNIFKINYQFIKILFEQLSKLEDNLMEEITIDYNKTRTNSFKTPNSDIELLIKIMDNYPLNNKMTHLINPISNKKWRMDYYHYLFYDHSETVIHDSCINYIEGLNWNLNYYFNKNYAKKWHYQFNYAPCLTDISKYLSTMYSSVFDKILLSTQNDNFKLDANIQLLMVLPPQSIDILPIKLQPIMKDVNIGCVHYVPNKFKLSTYLKYFGWECTPVLPNIDIDHLVNTVNIVNIVNEIN